MKSRMVAKCVKFICNLGRKKNELTELFRAGGYFLSEVKEYEGFEIV